MSSLRNYELETIGMADAIADALFSPPRKFNCTFKGGDYQLRENRDGRWTVERTRTGQIITAYPKSSACDAIELAERDGFEFDAEAC